MARIVVGVDGSEHAARALRRAVGEARLHGAKLDVVHAVLEPIIVAGPAWVPPPPRDEVRASALDAGVAVRGRNHMDGTIFHSDRGAGIHLRGVPGRVRAAGAVPIDRTDRIVPGQRRRRELLRLAQS